MITGSRSLPRSVRVQWIGVGALCRSRLVIIPSSFNSWSLLESILGVRAGFERRILLKLSWSRNPMSASMIRAHLRPSIPRFGWIGSAEGFRVADWLMTITEGGQDILWDPI
jgi:hypothetical protein